MIEEALFSAEEMMEKAIIVVKSELFSIRTGRANPSILNGITVESYGQQTPINQVSSISAPEPRMLIIKPYQIDLLNAIEKSIRNSDLGINPTNDGNLIRLVIPQLTEERRKELAKQAKAKGEEAKITIRNIRRKIMDELHKFMKNGEASEDEVARAEKDIDKLTQKYISSIEDHVKAKETELLEV